MFQPDFPDEMSATFIITDSPPISIDLNDINLMPIIADGLSQNLIMPLEDTMDVAAKYEPVEFHPVSPTGPPKRRVFAGDFDFQVEINAIDTHRKKYLYSNQLNRIYVDMKTDFPVTFRWMGGGPAEFVRATTVFSDESQAEKRVERCTQHTHETSNADIAQKIVKNVLHSSRERGTRGVYYCGQPDAPDSWYSVLVAPGPTGGSHAFQFVCKNSCSSGINRRAIEVIFTLEDANGNVYGRQTVGARVCSCPRRDMQRDETENKGRSGKRRAPAPPPAPFTQGGEHRGKKVKVEGGGSDAVVTLPPLEVGTRAALIGLQVMLSVTEASMEAKSDPRLPRMVQSLRDKIEELKRTQ